MIHTIWCAMCNPTGLYFNPPCYNIVFRGRPRKKTRVVLDACEVKGAERENRDRDKSVGTF